MSDPTNHSIALSDPPTGQAGTIRRGRSAEDLAAARALKAASRLEDEARQAVATVVVDGYTIRPAIGKTGGVDNVGWELIPPPMGGKTHNPEWYLATKELCLEAIPHHRARYAR